MRHWEPPIKGPEGGRLEAEWGWFVGRWGMMSGHVGGLHTRELFNHLRPLPLTPDTSRSRHPYTVPRDFALFQNETIAAPNNPPQLPLVLN